MAGLIHKLVAGLLGANDDPLDVELTVTAIRDALPAGTRIRSLRDTVPGVEHLTGYWAEEGVVVEDDALGVGNGNWAVVRFDDDPTLRMPGAVAVNPITGEEEYPVWAWPRNDLEVVE